MEGLLVIQAQKTGIESIRRAFINEGYRVINTSDDEVILEKITKVPSNLVFVVDDSLKGSQTCTMIRSVSDIPIVALCSEGEQNRVRMFELGADICVSWPVSPVELVARVHSLLRRYQQDHSSDADSNPENMR